MPTNRLVVTDRLGPILVVTLNRPESRNAIDSATAAQMNDAMDLLEKETGLFLGVITGAGGTFCSGSDLKELARAERRKPWREQNSIAMRMLGREDREEGLRAFAERRRPAWKGR